jgi:hypothetical protein
MASNETNTTSNSSQTTNAEAPAKRKSPAKSATAGKKSTRKESAKKVDTTASTEILFKEEPRPGLEAVPPYIWIDHPIQGERFFAPVYVIRMGVGGAERVEISIDKGAWRECRLTSGYWWYDWKDIARGKHALVARMKTAGGQWYRTPSRNIDY